MDDGLDDDEIRRILHSTRRIAIVGASNRPERPSFGVMAFLIQKGFDVTPVNPGIAGQQILGRTVVESLSHLGQGFDMVDIFRAPEAVGPVVDEAILLGARTIWMQLGIVHEAAARRAREAGLAVVMDRCPKWSGRGCGSRSRLTLNTEEATSSKWHVPKGSRSHDT